MQVFTRRSLFAAPLALALCLVSTAQGPPERGERQKGAQVDVLEPSLEASIAWYGRWDDAQAEAERTGRPILLMSAAPQCTGAPGIW